MREFESDEPKRRAVLAKHGLDFIDAIEVFGAPHMPIAARSETEERHLAIGKVNGVEIAVISTLRGPVCRIITARRARRNEREQYHAHVSGRSAPEEG